MSTQPEPPKPQEPSFLVAVARRFPGDPARQAAEIRSRLASMQRRGKALVDELRVIERDAPVLIGAAEALEAQVTPANDTKPGDPAPTSAAA